VFGVTHYLPATDVPGRLLIRLRTEQMLIHEQVHLAEYVKSLFEPVHAYGINDGLINLVQLLTIFPRRSGVEHFD